MAGLSKSMVDVGISMVLRDEFSNQAGRISGSFAGLMNDMQQWNRALTQQASAAFDYGRDIVGGMFSAYEHSAGIYDQIFMTSKIASATAEEQMHLMDLTKEINKETPLTNLDIASGERYLAMAGNTASQIENMIGPAAELASVFTMPLGGKGGTADMMTNIMATFNLASESATDVADILYRSTTSANISLTDLAQSFQYAGSTFRNAGIDMGMGAAMIGVLGNQGIQASSAGTALANMVRYLTLSITGQKEKGKKMLDAMGLTKEDLVDGYGNLKRMDEIIAILGERMKGLSGTAREVAMYNIFGVRGARAANALINDYNEGGNKLAEILSKEQDPDKSLHQTLTERLGTMQGRIDMWNASLDNFKTSLGQAVSVFNPILSKATQLVNWFGNILSTGVGKFTANLLASSFMVGVVVNGVRLLWGTIKMVSTMWGVINGQTSANTGLAGRLGGSYTIIENHLRTMVALMTEYMGLQMAAYGGSMTLPGGAVLTGKKFSKRGPGGAVITVTDPSGVTKTMTAAEYAAGGYVGAAAASGAGAAAGSTAAGARSRRTRTRGSLFNPMNWFGRRGRRSTRTASTGGVGSNVMGALGTGLMMFGGPWGLAAGVGLTLVSSLISSSNESSAAAKEQAEATKANTAALEKATAQQFLAYYSENFLSAMAAAVNAERKGNEPIRVKVTMNGTEMDWEDGGSYVVDTNEYDL